MSSNFDQKLQKAEARFGVKITLSAACKMDAKLQACLKSGNKWL